LANPSAPAAAPAPRLAALDALRGIAIGAMVVYHLSWDLSWNGLIAVDVATDPLWRTFARLIAGTFMALVGVNLVLATRHGFRLRPYLRRLAIIVAAAGLVSLGTWWFMPQTFVFFGILHSIAVASVLALPFLWAPAWVTSLAAAFFLAGSYFLTDAFFDAPALLWLGLSAHPVSTVDYVPVFPWFGVVLGGMVAGRLLVDYGSGSAFAHWRVSGLGGRVVTTAGRWSLPIYLVHQPILIGTLFLVAPFLGPSMEAYVGQLRDECRSSCAAVGYDMPTCEIYCGCLISGLERDGLTEKARSNALTAADREAWSTHLRQCEPKHAPAEDDGLL
jgi:uncharacterized membrane protein